MTTARLYPWRVMDSSHEFVVWACAPDDLAAQIHRKYAAWIRRPFEVRIDINDRLAPTGTGQVLEDDTWHAIARLRIRSAVTTPRRAA